MPLCPNNNVRSHMCPRKIRSKMPTRVSLLQSLCQATMHPWVKVGIVSFHSIVNVEGFSSIKDIINIFMQVAFHKILQVKKRFLWTCFDKHYAVCWRVPLCWENLLLHIFQDVFHAQPLWLTHVQLLWLTRVQHLWLTRAQHQRKTLFPHLQMRPFHRLIQLHQQMTPQRLPSMTFSILDHLQAVLGQAPSLSLAATAQPHQPLPQWQLTAKLRFSIISFAAFLKQRKLISKQFINNRWWTRYDVQLQHMQKAMQVKVASIIFFIFSWFVQLRWNFHQRFWSEWITCLVNFS